MEIPTTIDVSRIASSRVGQFTCRSSCRDSAKKFFMRANIGKWLFRGALFGALFKENAAILAASVGVFTSIAPIGLPRQCGPGSPCPASGGDPGTCTPWIPDSKPDPALCRPHRACIMTKTVLKKSKILLDKGSVSAIMGLKDSKPDLSAVFGSTKGPATGLLYLSGGRINYVRRTGFELIF